jgi:hypothetical protein
MTSSINSAFLAGWLWDLYAGEICSVYQSSSSHYLSHPRIHRKGDDKPTKEDEFKDDKDNCRNEEFTARDDKPTKENEFEDDNDDCCNKEFTARDNKPTKEDEFEDDNSNCRDE